LERAGVETACASWWTPDSIAGHLGSLLATDSQTNGGWFMYRWYGDMTGSMVQTASSLPKDGKNLDGFASLDVNARNATVVVGGVSDGTLQVVIKGFKSASFFDGRVHAVVDHTGWAGRGGIVTSTDPLSAVDLAIANDQVTVSIANANGDDGYRVSLTQVGVVIDGGGGGEAGSDGGSANRDANGAGRGGAGGAGGFGGQTGAGGAARADAAVDASIGAGGSIGSGGVTGLGSGGAPMGGTSAPGGMTGDRGGAASGIGGMGSGSGGAAGASTKPGESSGCSCAIQGNRQASAHGLLLLLGLGLWFSGMRWRRVSSEAGAGLGKVP